MTSHSARHPNPLTFFISQTAICIQWTKVCVCVCNALITSLVPTDFNRSLPTLERGLPDRDCTHCTFYKSNRTNLVHRLLRQFSRPSSFMTENRSTLCCNEIFKFLHDVQCFTSENSGFHPIFTIFGDQLNSMTICNRTLFGLNRK